MIDVHAHVLPFVDDGSPDTESSLKLLDDAAKAGVTEMFLTPHYMKVRNFISDHLHNQAVFDAFSEAAKQAGIPVKLHLGNEIYYTISTIKDLKNKTVVPLGNSNKVLLEFSLTQEEEDLTEAIHNMKALGYQPIIAHPERYPYLKPADYGVIKKMGALIQINAPSVTGRYGAEMQKTVFRMIKAGVVDFVGSDIHKARPNNMREAYDLVAQKFGLETAERLFNNATVL
jgi:protein-tyrosine phosphatase